ncbi:alanine racemase [bacterium]|nr:alanine racemase [bacterium]
MPGMIHHSSRLELSQSALKHNLDFLRRTIGDHPQICVVVKANAYGHGVEQFVPMAEACGVRRFAVASSGEAQSVHACLTTDSSVMIMGIMHDSNLEWVIEHGIEFYVFSLRRIENVARMAASMGRQASIHLEIETGGNRTGLEQAKLREALTIINRERRHLKLVGFCTHLAGAESLSARFRIDKQVESFFRVRKPLLRRANQPLYHVASSAAAMVRPEVRLDLVRIGTAVYGLYPSPDVHNLMLLGAKRSEDVRLRRVISWKTNVMQVREVDRDEFVGYGTYFQAPRDSRIAVIPIGYGNGYPREMSNRGNVLIRGRRAPIVGLVNMNMCFADVTNIPGVDDGDEVVLVGRQKKQEITIASFSEFSSALNTEFLSRLPADIPRHVVK